MATHFHTGNDLNMRLEQLFEEATERLILISPYIHLHERYSSVLKAKRDNDKLAITLVFGKNEEDPSRSMRREDLDFFIQFPNVDIRYEPRLHAKYYSNETFALITSMNLYRYSQDHNIEAGISMPNKSSVDAEAWNYFDRVVDQAQVIYEKRPMYSKGMLGLNRRYDGSEVMEDQIASFFTGGRIQASAKRSYPAKEIQSTPRATTSTKTGYCIRTGVPIAFNAAKPMCDNAFKSWSRYKDPAYSEKYCHFSGEPAHGETSFSRPILKKNWSKAKASFQF